MGNNNLLKEGDTKGCYCPSCKVFVEDALLEGLSLICPYCGSII